MLEDQARALGYRQIRAWSSVDKIAALHMWVALNYAMCPAVDAYTVKNSGEIVNGYYYAKLLHPVQQ